MGATCNSKITKMKKWMPDNFFQNCNRICLHETCLNICDGEDGTSSINENWNITILFFSLLLLLYTFNHTWYNISIKYEIPQVSVDIRHVISVRDTEDTFICQHN
jgi:hypothetical protein